MLPIAVPFVSARRDIIRHHFSSHCLPRRPIPINTGMVIPVSRFLTAGMATAALLLSARLSIRLFVPLPSAPAQSTRGTGRTTGRGCSRARCGRPAACPTGRRTGRAVSSRHGYHASVATAYPMRASDRSPPCRSFVSPTLGRSVPAWCHRSPALVMPAVLYRPAHRHEGRGAGRGECLLGVAEMMMCVGLKKAGGDFVPRPLASALSAV